MKMKAIILLLLAIVTCILNSGCKKSNPAPTSEPGYDIALSGTHVFTGYDIHVNPVTNMVDTAKDTGSMSIIVVNSTTIVLRALPIIPTVDTLTLITSNNIPNITSFGCQYDLTIRTDTISYNSTTKTIYWSYYFFPDEFGYYMHSP